MNDQQLISLIKLAHKALVLPRRDPIRQRLEQYLRCQCELLTFSKPEIDQLMQEFQQYPDHVRQSLIDRAQYPTSTDNFHLSQNDLGELNAARDLLPFHERAKWSVLRGTRAGLAWLDVGAIFSAVISIDDHSSPDRERRPYAHIWFKIGQTRHIETVDVLASVEKDPVALGHPVIAAAIKHWRSALCWKEVYERKVRDDDDPDLEWVRDHYTRRQVRIAESHLRALGKGFVASATNRSIGKKAALAILIHQLDVHDRHCFLYEVWKNFRNWEIPKDGDPFILDELRRNLGGLPIRQKSPKLFNITSENVIDFLTDTETKGGFRFTFEAKTKPRWETFRNAYLAWYLNADKDTIKNALTAANNSASGAVKGPGLIVRPLEMPLTNLLGDLLTTPLEFARAPITIDEPDGFEHLEDLILKKATVTK